nr:MAG TPA: hypothetical protein [Bacteriophage sp.]
MVILNNSLTILRETHHSVIYYLMLDISQVVMI